MLYAGVTVIAMVSCFYLLFRRANAIAPDITPPIRLRRWTAAFFASIALNHIWYMPIFFLSSSEDILMSDFIGGLLDSMTFFPLAIIVLFSMLQDRQRPLWIVAMMMAPLIAGGVWGIATQSNAHQPMIYAYSLLICIGLIIYMVREVRRYGHWLRDNYADLEHKEVWQSFVVLGIILLVFVVYAFTGEGPVYQYTMQVIIGLLICYLLWRVETLSNLCAPQLQSLPIAETVTAETEVAKDNVLSEATRDNIEALLQRHCIDTQLYLQHDLTLFQLAKAVGTNRFYLSQYFATMGITYNAYINDLRINHFISLYRKSVNDHRSFTAQQMAQESGFRNYNTFSSAFKRKTGQTVTAWMKAQERLRIS